MPQGRGGRLITRRALAVALCAGLMLSGVRCFQDLIAPPADGAEYTLEGIYPWVDTAEVQLNIGDILNDPELRLMNGTEEVPVTFRAEVLSGTSVVVLADGRVQITGTTDAVLRIRPVSSALPDTSLFLDVAIHPVVPRVVAGGPDSIHSFGASIFLSAEARTLAGAVISGVPISWEITAGGANAQLINAATGELRGIANGDVTLRAVSDTAHSAPRVIHVAQKADSIHLPPGTIVLRYLGQTAQLSPTVFDAMSSLIASASKTYTPKDVGVATASPSGLVTAQGDGLTWIIIDATGPGGGLARDSVAVLVDRGHLVLRSGNNQSASVGQPLALPLVVEILDQANAPLLLPNLPVTFTVQGGAAGRFGGQTSVQVMTDGDGRASVQYTLGQRLLPDTIMVTGAGLAGGAVTFIAQAAPPDHLTIEQEPGNVVAGASFSPSIRVAARDSFGTIVGPAVVNVTASMITSGGSSATLGGTLTQPLAGGQATFANLTPPAVTTGNRLVFTAPGLGPDTSNQFNVIHDQPAKLAFQVQPSNVAVSQSISPAMVVCVQDANGNLVDDDDDREIVIEIHFRPSGGSNSVSGSDNEVTVNGCATFPAVQIAAAGAGYRLRAVTPFLTRAISDPFGVGVGVPASMAITGGNNQNAIAGTVLAQPLQVRVLDAVGAPVQGDSVVFKANDPAASFGADDTLIVLTDVNGFASATLTAGPAAGNFTATAASLRLGPPGVTFSYSVVSDNLTLEFVTEPTAITGGASFSPDVVVRVKDGTGATVTGAAPFITLLQMNGTGTAGATIANATVQAVSGVATFTGTGVDRVGTGYRLIAVASTIEPDTSVAFNVTLGPAAQIAFASQPGNTTAGSAIAAFGVAVQDAGGNTVTGHAPALSMALLPTSGITGAQLSGTTGKDGSSGLASFNDLSIDSAGPAPYRLVASTAGLVPDTSAPFLISAGPAVQLRFRNYPVSVEAGQVIPAFTVLAQDALGNTNTAFSGSVVLVKQSGPGPLLGTTAVNADQGVATFSDLRIRVAAGGYSMSANSITIGEQVGLPFDVTPSAATQLAFTQQPPNTIVGQPMSPAIEVEVFDSLGNRTGSQGLDVTVRITGGTGTAGAVLSGDTVVPTNGGLAGFADLSIDLAGADYTLTAVAGTLAGLSATFDVDTAGTNKLGFQVSPGPSHVAGAPIVSHPRVQITDAAGTPITTATDVVTLRLGAGAPAGAQLRGDTVVAAVGGVAIFDNISIDSAGSYTLAASSPGLTGIGSGVFQIVAGDPFIAEFVPGHQPTSRVAGTVFSPSIQVAVKDSVGNLVTTAANIQMSIAANPEGAELDGTLIQPLQSGIATFADLTIERAGSGFVLSADPQGIAPDPVASNSFSITAAAATSIAVTPGGVSVGVGNSAQLSAEGRDAFGNVVSGLSLNWFSLNAAVAGTTSGGLVSGVGNGQTAIAVTASGITAYALATVSNNSLAPVNLWTAEEFDSDGINRVWGLSRNLVFGFGGVTGALVRRNVEQGGWSIPHPTPGSVLTAGWGTTPTDVWAVGRDFTSAHFDGNGWSGFALPDMPGAPNTHLWDVWGTSPASAFIVGYDRIYRYNGQQWARMTHPFAQRINAIWGTSDSNLFAVEEFAGAVLRFDGSLWSSSVPSGSGALKAVWGTSSSDVWTVGFGASGGIALHFNGSSWLPVPVQSLTGPPGDGLVAVGGAAPLDVYAVAERGSGIFRYDGTGFSLMPGTDSLQLNPVAGIWANPDGDMYLGSVGVRRGLRGATLQVGGLGTLQSLGDTAQYAANAFNAQGQPVTPARISWSSSAPGVASVDSLGRVIAVSNGTADICAQAAGGVSDCNQVIVQQVAVSLSVVPPGLSLSGIGSQAGLSAVGVDARGNPLAGPPSSVSWTPLNANVAGVLNGASNPTTAQAQGDGQTLIRVQSGPAMGHGVITVSAVAGTPVNLWRTDTLNAGATQFMALWQYSPSEVWAVGLGGAAWRYDGTSWSERPTGVGADLYGIWGTSPVNIYAVGANGTALRWDGGEWLPIGFPLPSKNLRAVWGSGPGNIMVVGDLGYIASWDGTTWVQHPITFNPALNRIWGSSRSNVHIAGGMDGGITLYHFNGDTVVAADQGGYDDEALDLTGAGDTLVFATTTTTSLLRWTGTAWSLAGGTPLLIGLWASASTDMYGIMGSLVHHFDGTWDTLNLQHDLFDITGSTTGSVWIATSRGVIEGVRGASITVTPDSPTLTYLGDTVTLAAQAFRGATPVDGVTFTWSKSNGNVLVDAATGLVTAAANGSAQVCATAPGGAQGCTTVTVQQVATSVVFVPDSASVLAGGSASLSVQAFDADQSEITGPLTLSCGTHNPAVVTVSNGSNACDADGVSSGQATISATVDGVTAYALITVQALSTVPVNLWFPMGSSTGQDLQDVWGTSENDVFAVGFGGVIRRFNGTSWVPMTSGTVQNLRSVWGSSAGNVYAVGDNGTVRRFDGTDWNVVDAGTTAHVLGVWGAAPNAVYIVTSNSWAHRFNGTAWADTIPTGTNEVLRGIWGHSRDNVFAVGGTGAGVTFQLNGSSWIQTPSARVLNQLWGTSSSDVFAVGAFGTVRRFNGASWSGITPEGNIDFNDVWGTSQAELYTVGFPGLIARSNIATWDTVMKGTVPTLRGVWGTSNGSVYAVGDGGTILRGYRGATVTITPDEFPTLIGAGSQLFLLATARTAGGSVITEIDDTYYTWISRNPGAATVDGNGTVTAQADGSSMIVALAPGGVADSVEVFVQVPASISVTPLSSEIIAIGGNVTLSATVRDGLGQPINGLNVNWSSLNPAVATIDASGFVTTVTTGQATLGATYGSLTGYALVHSSAVIAPPPPITVWSPVSSPTVQPLYNVWAADRDNVFAVGEGAVVLRYNGSSWQEIDAGSTARMSGVTGLSATDVHTVGSGLKRRFDGVNWSDPGSTVFAGWNDAWAAAPNRVYAIGSFAGGVTTSHLGRFDGTSWSSVASIDGPNMLAVWGSSDTNVLAVGALGTLLRWNGSAWSAPTAIASGPLTGIAGFGIEVFAVGSNGTIRRSTNSGVNWATMTAPFSGCCNRLWGTSGNDVWATTHTNGFLAHYNGSVWDTVEVGLVAGQLNGIGGTSNGDGWAVGQGGVILRGHRGATVTITPAAPAIPLAGGSVDLTATARTATNVVISELTDLQFTWFSRNSAVATVNAQGVVTAVSGGQARIVAFAPGGAGDSTTVTVQVPTSISVTPAGGASIADVNGTAQLTADVRDQFGQPMTGLSITWAAVNSAVGTVDGAGLVTGHTSGQTAIRATHGSLTAYGIVTVAAPSATPVNLWASVTTPNTTNTFFDAWAAHAGAIYAIALNSPTPPTKILRYDGSSWSIDDTPSELTPQSIHGVADTAVHMAISQQLRRRSASGWSGVVSDQALSWSDVWAATPTLAYAMAPSAGQMVISRFNGTQWVTWDTVSGNGRAIWGTSPTNIYIVGDAGLLHRWNGSIWTTSTIGGGANLSSIHGVSASELYVVGASNTFLRSQDSGATWSSLPAPPGITLGGDIWAGAANDIYSFQAGSGSIVARFNGSSWDTTTANSNVSEVLRAVTGTSNGHVFMVGGDGVVFQGFRGASVTVTPAAPSIVTAVQLSVEYRDQLGTLINGSVTGAWSSSNPAVATVSSSGLVTPISSGSVFIIHRAPGGAADTSFVTVSAGPVAWYPLDASGADVMGGPPANFVNISGAQDRNGIPNQAIDMDASGDFVLISPASTNSLSAGTISFWAFPQSTNQQLNLFSKQTGTANWFRAQFFGGPPIERWYFDVNGDGTLATALFPPIGGYFFTAWNHYAFVWSPAGRRLYFNGNLIAQDAVANVSPSFGDFLLGRNPQNTSSDSFRGLFDELRIYHVALTTAEVAALAAGVAPQGVTSSGGSQAPRR